MEKTEQSISGGVPLAQIDEAIEQCQDSRRKIAGIEYDIGVLKNFVDQQRRFLERIRELGIAKN